MALKDITLGQYFPGNSVVHRLDPRAKLIVLVVYIVALFMAVNWVSYALMVLFLLVQLVARAAFRHGFPWTEESAKICLIFLAYVGASMTSVNGTHINITILSDMLKGKAQKVVFVIQQLIAMAFLVLVFIYSFPALEIASRSVTTNTHINNAVIFAAVPISAVLMFFGHLMKIIVQLFSKEYVKEVDEDRVEVKEDDAQ